MRHLAIALLMLSACGKDEPAKTAAPACGPLKVTVDGQELTGLTHGLALTQKMPGEVSEQVQLFNHDKVTCEQVLSTSGRPVADGEISVRANAGRGAMGTGVGIESHAQLGTEVRVVGDKAAKPGDTLTLCVGETSFKPGIGDYKDKQVTIAGTFAGTYCGVQDLSVR